MGRFLQNKARRQFRAFFVSGVLLLALVWQLPGRADSRCAADHIDERVRISHVYDGDTLKLHDGRRVRLIGVNTPEIGREGRTSEPMAIASRDYLRRMVFGQGQILDLRFDQARQDRHGRTLAHAFLSDGTNVAATLLEQGYAHQMVVPPNLWSSGCYQKLASVARDERRGIWKLERYQAKQARQLSPGLRGVNVVTGQVTRVGKGERTTWIELDGRLALRIEDEELGYFRGWQLERLQGQRLEAVGSIYQRKGQLRMRVRHPSALRRPGADDIR